MADRYVYTSSLAPYMNGLLEKKRMDGYRYEDEAWHLKKLDDFLLCHAPDTKTITKETADLWCRKRDTEGNIFLKRRIVVLRQLCLYMTSMGNPAYIPKDLTSGEKPILYIPTEAEIRQFFDILDVLTFPVRYTRFSYEYRMLFRLYYCCGMRLSFLLRFRCPSSEESGCRISEFCKGNRSSEAGRRPKARHPHRSPLKAF